jgi:hypothetical protein
MMAMESFLKIEAICSSETLEITLRSEDPEDGGRLFL